MTDNNTTIIPFPDYLELKNEIEKLRTELSMLVLERDQLLYVECKNLEMKYMLELGSIEYKVYEAQCIFLRLKRKLEIIQGKINRQERIDIFKIDKVLDNEFAEYVEKLNEQIDRMNKAITRSKGTILSDEESKEIKRLYRNIVKAIHPDLNPKLSDEHKEMFNNTVEAYKNGDIDTLRIISEMVCNDLVQNDNEDAIKKLNSEKERLMKMLDNIKSSMDEIKAEFPYSMKEIILDKDKVDAMKSELEDNLANYTELIDNYTERINTLIK